MTRVVDISKWNIKEWIQTLGSRNKLYVENPENEKLYFFKESIERFPSEFWSEILASKIGQKLGFNMLDYNVGFYEPQVAFVNQ